MDRPTGNGAVGGAEESHELDVLPETKEECLVDIGDDTKTSDKTPVVSNDYEYSIRRTEESPDSNTSNAVDGADGYDVITQNGGKGLNGVAVKSPNDDNHLPTLDTTGASSQDPPYAVLDGPGSPDSTAPDDAPIIPKRISHDEEAGGPKYDTLREDNNSTPPSELSSDSPPASGDGDSSRLLDNGEYATLEEVLYDTVEGEDGSEDTKM